MAASPPSSQRAQTATAPFSPSPATVALHDERSASAELERGRQQSRLAAAEHRAAETGRAAGTGMQVAGTAAQGTGAVMRGAGAAVSGLGAAVAATRIGAPVGAVLAAAGSGIGTAGQSVSAAGGALRQAGGVLKAGARGLDEAADAGGDLASVAGAVAAVGSGMAVRQLLHAGLKSPFSPIAALAWVLFAFFALLGARLCQHLDIKDYLAIGISAVELLVIFALVVLLLNPCGIASGIASDVWSPLGNLVGGLCPGGGT